MKIYENLRKDLKFTKPFIPNRFLKPVWQAHQNRFQLVGNRFHPALQNRFWRNRFSPKPVFNETGLVAIDVKTGSVTDFRFGLRPPCEKYEIRQMFHRLPIDLSIEVRSNPVQPNPTQP